MPHKGNPFKFEPLHVGFGAHLHAAASAADTPSSLVKGVGKGYVDVTIDSRDMPCTALIHALYTPREVVCQFLFNPS